MSLVKDVHEAHRTLNLEPYASDEDLNRAHRSMARCTHPDFGGSHESFVRVQLAYELLADLHVRERYYFECLSSETTSSRVPPNSEARSPNSTTTGRRTWLAVAAVLVLLTGSSLVNLLRALQPHSWSALLGVEGLLPAVASVALARSWWRSQVASFTSRPRRSSRFNPASGGCW
jgi:hypothetical protein